MRIRLACAVAVVLALLLGTGVGFALGAQAQRFGRCQQLSAQYVAALEPPTGSSDTLQVQRLRNASITTTRDAYQQACG